VQVGDLGFIPQDQRFLLLPPRVYRLWTACVENLSSVCAGTEPLVYRLWTACVQAVNGVCTGSEPRVCWIWTAYVQAVNHVCTGSELRVYRLWDRFSLLFSGCCVSNRSPPEYKAEWRLEQVGLLIFKDPELILYTTSFSTKQFYILPTLCISVIFTDVRKTDHYPIQQWLICF
jgi:hypothetical protein